MSDDVLTALSGQWRWGLYSPYKPCNHNLYIGIIIFPHKDRNNKILKNKSKDRDSNFLVIFSFSKASSYWEKRRDGSLMLAMISTHARFEVNWTKTFLDNTQKPLFGLTNAMSPSDFIGGDKKVNYNKHATQLKSRHLLHNLIFMIKMEHNKGKGIWHQTITWLWLFGEVNFTRMTVQTFFFSKCPTCNNWHSLLHGASILRQTWSTMKAGISYRIHSCL